MHTSVFIYSGVYTSVYKFEKKTAHKHQQPFWSKNHFALKPVVFDN